MTNDTRNIDIERAKVDEVLRPMLDDALKDYVTDSKVIMTGALLDLVAFASASIPDSDPEAGVTPIAISGDKNGGSYMPVPEMMLGEKELARKKIKLFVDQQGGDFCVISFEGWGVKASREQADALAGSDLSKDDRRESVLISTLEWKEPDEVKRLMVITPIKEKERRSLDFDRMEVNTATEGRHFGMFDD
jgi:hypothetical protein